MIGFLDFSSIVSTLLTITLLNTAVILALLSTFLSNRFWFPTLAAVVLTQLISPWLLYFAGRARFMKRSSTRKNSVIQHVRREQENFETQERLSPKSEDEGWENFQGYAVESLENGAPAKSEWDGVVGFLHPFCNAGGGGERVLWAAIKATQEHWPRAICVVYTGDHGSAKSTILERVESRFNIHLHPPTVVFLYLDKRDWVVASTWPYFTLLGQILGSLYMAYEALSLLTPDVFVDTMGYAFSLWLCKFFFPSIPTGAYVHYPFIGTHMVESLTDDSGQGVNAGAGRGVKGFGKKLYWYFLVKLYAWTGSSIDVVMTNSSWTQAHMQHLWGQSRKRCPRPVEVVFPPVAVEELIEKISLEGANIVAREDILVYIAQFRPEKNHELILQAFSRMVHSQSGARTEGARLILIGSVRDDEDKTLVYKLRLQATELKIADRVEFRTQDISWSEILDWLRKASVGVNGMWCEHFGIGVVEYQAAGLISVVNDSGGPKADIVVDYDGGPTGKPILSIVIVPTRLSRFLTLMFYGRLSRNHRNRICHALCLRPLHASWPSNSHAPPRPLLE